ncbi:xyloglucanase [Micromonospora sp. KLBMP9576]|uniref:xyloglucanase n=1 Tax=Micromonospora sp. KLBMP9576 TaxID=3424769 RepID=UPI003D900072
MRRSHLGAVVSALLVAAAVVATPFTAAGAPAAAAESYTWKNVRIDGGGFVPGIVFNPTEKDLIYARTDIGGMYRWEQARQSWTPLLDWVGADRWGWNGVVSVATDPVQTNRVYAAVGMYTTGWDPDNGAILRSADRGATWQATELPFKNGGNMPGRGMGERLAVDPNRNSILYYGAEGGNGLWRSTDFGATWAKVTNFPNVGNYRADPSDPNGYNGQNQGLTWVSFDRSTGTAGTATQTVYVGVADKENPVYRSTNGGASWERIAGQPTGYLAHKGVVDPVGGFLYIATSDTGGPYDGGKGDVWRFDRATGAWTRISPVPSTSTDAYFGYSGLTIDRQRPNTLMVATQTSWWPDAIFWRSTDGGATWTRIWEFTSYPNRSKRYTMDVSSVPWLTFGSNPAPPEEAPKLGWMNESVEIDPHDSNRFLYGTGATIYGSTDLTRWDAGDQFTIRPMVKGLEETAVLDLVSPPSGAPLISALGDIGGFRHTDLDAVPPMMFTQPNFTSTTSLDYAETKPAVLVGPATSPTRTAPTTATSRSPLTAGRPGSRAPSRPASTAAARSPRRPTAAGSSGRRATPASGWCTRSGSAPRGPRRRASRPTRPSSPTGSTRTSSTPSPAACSTSAPTAGRASPPRPPPACPPPATSSSRRCPAGRASCGWPARAGCGAPPTPGPPSPGWRR